MSNADKSLFLTARYGDKRVAHSRDPGVKGELDEARAALRAHLEDREAVVRQMAEALENMHDAFAQDSGQVDRRLALADARAALAAYRKESK